MQYRQVGNFCKLHVDKLAYGDCAVQGYQVCHAVHYHACEVRAYEIVGSYEALAIDCEVEAVRHGHVADCYAATFWCKNWLA